MVNPPVDPKTKPAPQQQGVVDLNPAEDFTAPAANARELKNRWAAVDKYVAAKRKTAAPAEVMPSFITPEGKPTTTTPVTQASLGVSPFADLTPQRTSKRLAEAQNVLDDYDKHVNGRDISGFKAVNGIIKSAKAQGVTVTPADVSNLVNFAVLDSAANQFITAAQVGDKIGMRNVATTLNTNNPLMASLLPEYVQTKIKEYSEDPSVIANVAGKIGEVLGAAIQPLVAINNAATHWYRANQYQNSEGGIDALSWIPFNGGFRPSAWEATADGTFNTEYLASLAKSGEYTPLQIQIALDVTQASIAGDSDAIINVWQDKYADNDEAAKIFRDIMYVRPNSNMQELLRQVDSANQGNTGQLTLGEWGGNAYDPGRGSQSRQSAANIYSGAVSFAIDPTNLAFGAGRIVQAAKWNIARLAPGAEAAEVVLRQARFGKLPFTSPVYRYFDQFTKNLNELDDLASAASKATSSVERTRLQSKAADLRIAMSRQFDEMPDDLIDDFYKNMPRNAEGKFDVQTAAAFIDDGNTALKVVAGKPAPSLLDYGAATLAEREALAALQSQHYANLRAAQEATFYHRVTANTETRDVLIPRMSIIGQLRRNAVNDYLIDLMPRKKVLQMIDKYLDSENSGTFAQSLSDNALALGNEARAYKFRTGEGLLDSTTRMFSSIPNISVANLASSQDATQIMRYARMFFPKRVANMIGEAWTKGSIGDRRLILSGLVRSAGASRGLVVTEAAADDMVRQLTPAARAAVTGSMQGERYGLTVDGTLLPSERAYAIDAAKKAESVAPAWENGPTLFHGTSKRFDEDFVHQPDYFSQSNNIAGSGFYSTTSRNVSENGYTKKGTGKNPFLYSVHWKGEKPPVVVDADAPAPQYVRDFVLSNENSTAFDWLNESAIDVAKNPQSSIMDIIKAIRKDAAAHGMVPKYEVEEVILDLNYTMQDNGVDAIKHLGGVARKSSKEKHDVYVWLNTENVGVADAGLDVSKIKPSSSSGGRVTHTEKNGTKWEFNGSKWEQVPSDNLSNTDGDLSRSLSADANGIEHAMHLNQTSDYVHLPSLKDFEDYRKEMGGLYPARNFIGNVMGNVTNWWSLGTLFGFRFSMRNAIEELGMYWLTGGSIAALQKGRRADQAMRRVHPRVKIEMTEEGVLKAVYDKSSLGMIAKRTEKAAAFIKSRNLPDWITNHVLGGFDEQALADAVLAYNNGDRAPFIDFFVQSLAAQRMTGYTPDDIAFFKLLADSTHGMNLIDDVAEASKHLNTGGYPAYLLNTHGTKDLGPGVGYGTIKNAPATRLTGYGNVAPNTMGASFWWRELQSTFDNVEWGGDGVLGQTAARYLKDPAKAKAEVAKLLREDTAGVYRGRLSRLSDDMAIDDFADSYVENLFAHFSRKDGSLNTDLWSKFFEADGTFKGWWQELETGGKVFRVSKDDLLKYADEDRPDAVFGQLRDAAIPVPQQESALLSDRAFNWMGEQNARISKEPIFLANATDLFGQSKPARDALISELTSSGTMSLDDATAVANRLYAQSAMDGAYSLTMAYVDNPSNRSNLAWKARNLARYYRATEDFYRRVQRIAKHSPEAFWKGALTYHCLQDAGFIYTDDNGEAYFAYPGNELVQGAVSNVFKMFTGVEGQGFDEIDPFSIGGKVLGLTPSSDVKQAFPSFSGPVSGIGLATVFSIFPSLQGLRAATMGSYSTSTGSWFDDVKQAVMPAGFTRLSGITDQQKWDSSVAQSGIDALLVMSAEGMLDEFTITDRDGKKTVLDQAIATPDEFRRTDQYQQAQAIAVGLWVTKTAMSFLVPASPQKLDNNVSSFARHNGIDSMSDAFKDLLDKNKDMPDPWAAATSAFMALQAREMAPSGNMSWKSMLPFTMSSYKWDSEGHPIASLARPAATDVAMKWIRDPNNAELFDKFGDAAYFLSPATGGDFTWDAWNFQKAVTGIRVSKTEEEQLQDLFSLQGRTQAAQIRNEYAKRLAAALTSDERKQIQKEMDQALQVTRLTNPAWDQRWEAPNKQAVQAAYVRTRDMLAYMKERDGKLTPEAQLIQSSIDIWSTYSRKMSGLYGNSTVIADTRKRLQAEMEAHLASAGEASPVAKRFIDNVLLNADFQPAYVNVFGE